MIPVSLPSSHLRTVPTFVIAHTFSTSHKRRTSARYANVLLNGEVAGKNVIATIKIFKKGG